MSDEEKQRSIQQNKSLHKYADDLAKELNAAGYDQRAIIEQFKEGFEIPWTMYAIKDLFRTIGFAMFGKESTADLSTFEMQEVYRVFDKRMSELSHVHVEWPSEDSLRMKQILWEKCNNE